MSMNTITSMFRAFAITALLACLGSTAVAPAEERADLAAELTRAVDAFKQPGMAAAVVHGERIIALGVAGKRRHDQDDPITIDDRFHTGSCTKSITSTLAALFVEEERLAWETTITEVFPELVGAINPAYEQVTLAQLLSHTAGLPTYTAPRPEQMAKIAHLEDQPRKARRAFLDLVLNEEPLVTAGAGYRYSNAGYAVAAAMIEQVADAAWDDLIRAKLFEPLKLRSAHLGWPNVKDERQPWGHAARNESIMAFPPSFPYRLPAALHPGGDVSMTIEDFAIWASIHLRGLRGEHDLLDQKTFSRLHQPVRNNYAMGWLRAEIAGKPATLHNGSAGTFFALMTIWPEENIAIVVFTNAGSGEKACDDVTRRLFERYAETTQPPETE